MIKMYWWEGYYGYKRVLSRVIKGKRPYVRNFGDQLSPFIVSMLSKQKIKHSIFASKLLALGSIFFSVRDHDMVWGSGFINANHLHFALAAQNVKYLSVRGPKTRDILIKHGIDCPAIFGDPALLLPLFVKNDIVKKYSVGIIPHFSHYLFFIKTLSSKKIKIINAEKPYYEVMRDILSCDVILSSSLHGLIVSEAYGIPSYLLTVGKPLHGDLFKFEDYFNATDRHLSFIDFLKNSDIHQLVQFAIHHEKPKINIDDMIKVFPYQTHCLASPTLKWSDNDFSKKIFHASIIPPSFYVPDEE